MKGPVPPEPQALDMRSSGPVHAERLGIHLQLLEMGGSGDVLNAQGVLDNGEPVSGCG